MILPLRGSPRRPSTASKIRWRSLIGKEAASLTARRSQRIRTSAKAELVADVVVFDPFSVRVAEPAQGDFQVLALLKMAFESFDDKRGFGSFGRTGQIFEPRSTASGLTTLTLMPASAPSRARQRARWTGASRHRKGRRAS